MADTWGKIQLPVLSDGDKPVTDPALFYLSTFVQAVLNADAADSWGDVAHSPVCRKHFEHNPQDEDVSDRDFPAVFVWSEDGDISREADDWLVDRRVFQILWVFEPAKQLKQFKRRPFFNGLVKSLARAFDKGRHPAWVVDGDTDARAATAGSLLWKFCGFSKHNLLKPQTSDLQIEVYDGAKIRAYDGVLFPIEGWEKLTEDPTLYPATKGTTDLVEDDESVNLRAVENPAES